MSANTRQPGGDHYKKFGQLQPWDVINHFKLGFFDGNAVKYLLRWRHKGSLLDLQKAQHYIEKLLEIENKKYEPEPPAEGAMVHGEGAVYGQT